MRAVIKFYEKPLIVSQNNRIKNMIKPSSCDIHTLL